MTFSDSSSFLLFFSRFRELHFIFIEVAKFYESQPGFPNTHSQLRGSTYGKLSYFFILSRLIVNSQMFFCRLLQVHSIVPILQIE